MNCVTRLCCKYRLSNIGNVVSIRAPILCIMLFAKFSCSIVSARQEILGKYFNWLHAKFTLTKLLQSWKYSSGMYAMWYCSNDKIFKVIQTALIGGGSVKSPFCIKNWSSPKPCKLFGLTFVIGLLVICIFCNRKASKQSVC